jgi:hypothetical protein
MGGGLSLTANFEKGEISPQTATNLLPRVIAVRQIKSTSNIHTLFTA